jgi:tRNA threonylcarbamoyladenosine biosynthesis protein TsaE
MKTFITKNFKETRELGKNLALKIKRGTIIALKGNLGSGKTTFTQGFLKGLKVKGPYTSPTFVIIKRYELKTNNQQPTTKKKKKLSVVGGKLSVIYHMDAYRVSTKDILNLGWKEMIAKKNNIIIIEWADRIKEIIPRGAIWIKFKWLDEDKREITFK